MTAEEKIKALVEALALSQELLWLAQGIASGTLKNDLYHRCLLNRKLLTETKS